MLSYATRATMLNVIEQGIQHARDLEMFREARSALIHQLGNTTSIANARDSLIERFKSAGTPPEHILNPMKGWVAPSGHYIQTHCRPWQRLAELIEHIDFAGIEEIELMGTESA